MTYTRFGTAIASDLVSVRWKNKGSGVWVYPNPVSDRRLQMQFIGMVQGSYRFCVLDASGRAVFSGRLQHSGSDGTQLMQVLPGLPRGSYLLRIDGPDGQVYRQPLVLMSE